MRRVGELLAVLRRTDVTSTPTGWALTLDSAIAVAAAAAAVLEVAHDHSEDIVSFPQMVLLAPMVTHHADTLTLVVAALTALPLAVRRLYPITTWLVILAAAFALGNSYEPPVAFASAVLAAYSAVAHSRYRNLAIGTVLAGVLVVTATFADTLPRFPGRLTAVFAIVPAMAAGLGIRQLRQRLRVSTARLQRATEEYEVATRRAIEAERARIAGELHDVVTHNVSVMVVQAGAARTVLASSPREAEQALLAVEASGRTAMTELRHLLGLLSPSREDASLRPQPGLGELDTLIGRVSAAGLPVQLHVSGTPRPLPPGGDLAAYRVVQEALTNVLRHAGMATTSVTVDWGAMLVVAVTNNGDGSSSSSAGPGRGLLGLRERLSLYGGQLDAGPVPGGGWQVRAVLPAGSVG